MSIPIASAASASAWPGYYAPRGTAFEPRIKALVLWCACYDILEELYNWYPPIQRPDPAGSWASKDDAQAREKLTNFNLKGIAQKITCPTLISHGVGDVVMDVDGAQRLYEEIGSKDKLLKLWERRRGRRCSLQLRQLERLDPVHVRLASQAAVMPRPQEIADLFMILLSDNMEK